MARKNRSISILLLIVLCAFILFSQTFFILERDHDCTGEHCGVCEQIKICVGLFNNIHSAWAQLALFLLAILLVNCFYVKALPLCYSTLVSLRVKLTN